MRKGIYLFDSQKIEKAASSIIEAIGEDPNREGLSETPRRIAAMYEELFAGMDQDPAEALATGFEEGHTEMVLLRNIPFSSVCEHHFLPFFGTADIGYVPNGRVAGASKLARALDALARRPQIQERLTKQLVDCIMDTLKPKGVGVVISAEHLCISVRGVGKMGSRLVTRGSRGSIRTDDATRREFESMIKQ
jgi:GTP cyclohydrolase I